MPLSSLAWTAPQRRHFPHQSPWHLYLGSINPCPACRIEREALPLNVEGTSWRHSNHELSASAFLRGSRAHKRSTACGTAAAAPTDQLSKPAEAYDSYGQDESAARRERLCAFGRLEIIGVACELRWEEGHERTEVGSDVCSRAFVVSLTAYPDAAPLLFWAVHFSGELLGPRAHKLLPLDFAQCYPRNQRAR